MKCNHCENTKRFGKRLRGTAQYERVYEIDAKGLAQEVGDLMYYNHKVEEVDEVYCAICNHLVKEE